VAVTGRSFFISQNLLVPVENVFFAFLVLFWFIRFVAPYLPGGLLGWTFQGAFLSSVLVFFFFAARRTG